jgi:hypothetical protein
MLILYVKNAPQKTESARTYSAVDGNLIVYPGDTLAPTADVTALKLHVNSVLSTPGAKVVCAKSIFLFQYAEGPFRIHEHPPTPHLPGKH